MFTRPITAPPIRTGRRAARSRIRIRPPGTNNWYTEDGYGNSFNAGFPPPYTAAPVSGGGSYSDCSDSNAARREGDPRLPASLAAADRSALRAGHYYLLNNYNPGYFGNGKNAYTDQNPANTPFTVPPSSTPSIGDDLNDQRISWKYYGDQWNNYVNDPYQLNYGTPGPKADEYCNICNPFQYDTSIMSHPDQVAKPHPGHGRTCTRTSRTARCPRFRSSSRAATSTAIRLPRSSICSRAS